MPDDMTTVGRLLQLPPIPDIPEPLRGRSFVGVQAFYLGTEAEGAALVAPIRALGPEIDTVATIPAAALQHVHMDPEQPVPGLGDGMLLDDLPAAGIDALVAAAGPESGSPLLSVEVRQLGGAIGQPAAGGGALSHLDADFVLFGVGIAMSPEMGAAVAAHRRRHPRGARVVGGRDAPTSTSPSATSPETGSSARTPITACGQ